MTLNRGGLLGMVLGAGLLAGCAETQNIHVQALAPTPEEGKALAQGQLDQRANELLADTNAKGGYHLVGTAHFKTKVLAQADGGQVYEVTGDEKVERPRF
jgi:hypothetical protein